MNRIFTHNESVLLRISFSALHPLKRLVHAVTTAAGKVDVVCRLALVRFSDPEHSRWFFPALWLHKKFSYAAIPVNEQGGIVNHTTKVPKKISFIFSTP